MPRKAGARVMSGPWRGDRLAGGRLSCGIPALSGALKGGHQRGDVVRRARIRARRKRPRPGPPGQAE